MYAIDAAGNVGGPASRTFTVVSDQVQECLDAQAALAVGEADLSDARSAIARMEAKLRKAKKADRRNRMHRVRAKLNRAKGTRKSALAAVATAQQAVAENCA